MAGVYDESPRIIPEAKMKEAKLPARRCRAFIRRTRWNGSARASRAERPTPISRIFRSAHGNLLVGQHCQACRQPYCLDAENLKITNLPEANKYVRSEYRKGWSL